MRLLSPLLKRVVYPLTCCHPAGGGTPRPLLRDLALARGTAMLWYEELYLTFLDVPEGAFEGTFCGVPVKTHRNSSVPQRTSCCYDLVELLSRCDAQARLGFAGAVRAKFDFPGDWSRGISSKGTRASGCSGVREGLRRRFGRTEQVPAA